MGEGPNSKIVEIGYIPLIPRKLLIWGLNNLMSGDETQMSLKRRLVRMAANSVVPVNLLPKITGLGLGMDQFQRTALPLSSWRDHINSIALNTMAQDSLRCANFHLNQNISEATFEKHFGLAE